jgi:hypothetical protein
MSKVGGWKLDGTVRGGVGRGAEKGGWAMRGGVGREAEKGSEKGGGGIGHNQMGFCWAG